MKRFLVCSFICMVSTFYSVGIFAQPPQQRVRVMVTPDHRDWMYKINEEAKFTITILKDNHALPGAVIRYEVGPEKMEPVKKDSLALKNGSMVVSVKGMEKPGFIQCIVTAFHEGKQYRSMATVGVEPTRIQPVVEEPSDFRQFWDSCKRELAGIAINPRMTLIPERCTDKVNVYHVSLQNINRSRVYGILCVPKKEGKYPALLRVPGAGIRPYNGDVSFAEKGVITLEIGIHGIPVNMPVDYYENLSSGALNGYWYFNLDNRDRYYYKRVYLGCVRAVDFIDSLPQYDGKNLAVTGGSQGGALSIITASLDKRVKWLSAFYPALSDMPGYTAKRAGGWPHLFDKNNGAYNNTPQKLETIRYYDVVNFARHLQVPGFYSWGFNDNVCPPTSMYASYNVIKAPKELYLALETGHWTFPEQDERSAAWLLEKLGK